MKRMLLLKLALSAGLVGFLVWYIDLREILDTFRQAGAGYLALAFILLAPNLFMQWYKWHRLVRIKSPGVPPFETFRSLIIAFALGMITPGRTGEYSRPWFIRASAGKPVLFAYTALDKLYGMIALFFVSLPALIYHYGLMAPQPAGLRILQWAGYGLFCAVIFFFILNPGVFSGVLKRIDIKPMRTGAAQKVIEGLAAFTRPESMILFLLSSFFVCIYIFQFYVVMYSFSPLPLLSGLSALPPVILVGTVLPVFFGNLGIRELSSVYFLRHIGIMPAAAFSGSLLLFAINILTPALIGFALFLFYPGDRRIPDTETAGKASAA